MPDDNGKLTAADRQKVVEWLNRFNPSPVCPFCNSDHWFVGEHIVAPLVVSKPGFVLGGTSYPVVPVVSVPCGQIVFFSAVIIGLYPPSPQPAAAPLKSAVEENASATTEKAGADG